MENEFDELDNDYDREKTLAIVTGLVCALIFLCGTVLGGYHSIKELGAIGILSVACYLIADIAIAWAAYIDYQEDKNAMEWTAWAVKYILSVYLLFSGGCIAYLLIKNSGMDHQVSSRAEIYQRQYDSCMAAKNATAAKCRALASEFNKAETQNQKEQNAKAADSAGFVEWYLSWPLFKYLPGMLGLGGLFALTLVAKLVKGKRKRQPSEPILTTTKSGKVIMGKPVAPLLAPKTKYKAISNGKTKDKAASFRFSESGGNYSINFRHNKRELYGIMASPSEIAVLATLTFDELARHIIKERRSKSRNDATADAIESVL